jgi:hypothetical protein
MFYPPLDMVVAVEIRFAVTMTKVAAEPLKFDAASKWFLFDTEEKLHERRKLILRERLHRFRESAFDLFTDYSSCRDENFNIVIDSPLE